MINLKEKRTLLFRVGSVAALFIFILLLRVPPGSSAPGEYQRARVNFPHESHMEVGACLDCHHKYERGENVLDEDELAETEPDGEILLSLDATDGESAKCASCHNEKSKIEGMEAFHQMCLGCHAESEKGPAMCGECHLNR